MNVIVETNKTLSKKQFYELTKFLFLIGASLEREFNPNGKLHYVIKHGNAMGFGNAPEIAMRKLIEQITQPNYHFLSNNWKRKLNRILKWR